MTLGDIIRNYRKERGLSMEDFARLCNMSKGYISMLEKNKNPRSGKPIIPSVATYSNISKAMNIKIEDLMGMVDKNQPIDISSPSPAPPTTGDSHLVMTSNALGVPDAEYVSRRYAKLDEAGKEAVKNLISIFEDAMKTNQQADKKPQSN